MVGEVFGCWILDCVEPAESSIVTDVLSLSLVRFELKEVWLVFNHELVELVEFLLGSLVIDLVLSVFFRLQEQILLVGLEQTALLFFASHQHSRLHVVHALSIVVAYPADKERAHHARGLHHHAATRPTSATGLLVCVALHVDGGDDLDGSGVQPDETRSLLPFGGYCSLCAAQLVEAREAYEMRGCLGSCICLNFCLELASLYQLRLTAIILDVDDVLQLRHEAVSLRTVEDHLHGVELLAGLHQLHPVLDSHHLRHLW